MAPGGSYLSVKDCGLFKRKGAAVDRYEIYKVVPLAYFSLRNDERNQDQNQTKIESKTPKILQLSNASHRHFVHVQTTTRRKVLVIFSVVDDITNCYKQVPLNTSRLYTLRVEVPMTRITIQSSFLPLLQAVLTGTSTALGVILVVLWRPQRTRALPFYSDASHNDPERIILSCGENLACMLMPLVAIIEYLHHTRLLTFPHRQLHFRFLPSLSSSHIVHLNFFVTACTTIFFFITANVPSRFPATRLHQFAASALILFYALQATCKAVLAYIFANYRRADTDPEKGDTTLQPAPRYFTKTRLFWDRHHMKLRVLLASALWLVLIGTWVCFTGRVIARKWGSEYDALRNGFSACMAALVHVATLSCVTLMGVMAVDMRDERLVLSTKGD